MSAGSRVEIDLDAITANVATLAEHAAGAQVMAVVKADGYGHGMLPSARAALAGGASWLGVAGADEAQALRAGGIVAPVLCWLTGPADDLAPLVEAGVDLSVASLEQLAAVVAAGRSCGRRPRVHLKIDTGLSRNGAQPADWPSLCAAAADADVEVVAVWSHLAYADAPTHPTIDRARERFELAVDQARAAGLTPSLRHLANSAATLTRPDTHYELVRPGLAVYGLSPVPDLGGPAEFGLRPAMRLRSELALVKTVPAGEGVSYGHRYTTTQSTRLGLVPLGYADGVPRHATNTGPVLAAGAVRRVAGTVCMDQFVLDLGPDSTAAAGDEVVLFGAGDQGEPTAQDWAVAAGTISYEIVTRLGARVPRSVTGAAADGPGSAR